MNELVDEQPQPEPAPPAPAPEPQPTPDPEPPAGTPEADENESTVEEPGAENELLPAFDVEAFVKSLPEGVVLCPVCIGLGGVVNEPPFDPHTHACATCRGRTRVRTGAVQGGEVERQCPDCQGKGWLLNEPEAPVQEPARAEHFAGGTPQDYAGRTPDHPDFDWARVVPRAPAPPPVEEPAAVG